MAENKPDWKGFVMFGFGFFGGGVVLVAIVMFGGFGEFHCCYNFWCWDNLV